MTYEPTYMTFVSLKAFGDLVITNSCLQRIEPQHKKTIGQLIGNHLTELNEALGYDWEVVTLTAQKPGVPAIFDIRKKGPLKAMSSALELRSAIKTVDLNCRTVMIFDRVKRREQFLAAGRPILSLPRSAENIYQAYISFFRQQGVAFDATFEPCASKGSGIGIFPGSRIADKNLSHRLIREVFQICAADAHGVTLFLLEGERPDLESIGIPYQIVPRSFKAMYDAVKGCNLIIGADSMPVHIAEACGKAVFVLSPVPNRYWLPLSSFKNGYWALFDDESYTSRLEEFISSQGHKPD